MKEKKELFYLIIISIISLMVLGLVVFCNYLIVSKAKDSLSDDLRLINNNQMTMNDKLDKIIDYLDDWELSE